MKLIKFRIKNYKSVIDSEDCYFSDKFTILAGKNECGKTTILKALSSFDENSEIGSVGEVAPIGTEDTSKIFVTFRLNPEEIKEIYESAKIDKPLPQKNVDIELLKSSDTNKYTIAFSTIQFDDAPVWVDCLAAIKTVLDSVDLSALSIDIDNQDAVQLKARIDPIVTNGRYTITNPQTGIQQAVGVGEATKSSLISAQQLIDEFINNVPDEQRFIATFVETLLPYFIMFSSFDDFFPDEIALSELSGNEWAKDLQEVSSFRIDKISNAVKQTQTNHQSDVNAEFTDQFNKYWTQESIKLEVEKDDGKIYFWIIEGGRKYKPSQRSQGQKWYLSFYIKVIARIAENRPNVVLIDEPGLYLHAQAQKDLLKVLDDQAFDYPVIFSTHSPYLITEKKLGDIRLVEKTDNRTKILGKVWSKVSDGETLTPILTAIGLGINDSICDRNKANNVVLEGMEDVFYMRAFYAASGRVGDINFINGGGATNMGKIGSILEGWGGKVLYMLDNDTGGESGKKELKKWDVPDESITFVTDSRDCATVDVLTVNDFKKYVIENNKAEVTKNSKYIRDNKLEKVLLARKFLELANSGTVKLAAKSLNNIDKLANSIRFD